jgi:hypothetical protein
MEAIDSEGLGMLWLSRLGDFALERPDRNDVNGLPVKSLDITDRLGFKDDREVVLLALSES